MTAEKAVLFAVVLLALLAGWALARFAVRRFKTAQSMFDMVTAEPAHPTYATHLSLVPAGFTCMECGENPALPDSIFCIVCSPVPYHLLSAEPIERGGQR